MLTTQNVQRVILAAWKVDFRKSHLGLLGECRLAGFEPWSGDCVVFVSRCRTKVKVLLSDATGLWVSYKQFAKGTLATEVHWLESPSGKEVTHGELAMILEGHRFVVEKRKETWKPRSLNKGMLR
jgi:hypothetical protein